MPVIYFKYGNNYCSYVSNLVNFKKICTRLQNDQNKIIKFGNSFYAEIMLINYTKQCILFNVRNSISTPFVSIFSNFDLSIFILPNKISNNGDIYKLVKRLQFSFLDKFKGLYTEFPVNKFEKYIRYRHTNNKLLDLDCMKNTFPKDISSIITNYIGDICTIKNTTGYYIIRGSDEICSENHDNSLTKDYVFVNPCCDETQCISCTIKYMEESKQCIQKKQTKCFMENMGNGWVSNRSTVDIPYKCISCLKKSTLMSQMFHIIDSYGGCNQEDSCVVNNLLTLKGIFGMYMNVD
jgi:hypothetical protein